jgi:2-polyprenyl-3-methyl-5-hydroxy-6-metoxy-1,4-benzoquinol methylase
MDVPHYPSEGVARMEPVVWEDVACPLCGARGEEPVLEARNNADTYRVVRCRRCQFAYLNPRPDERTIGHFYPADYHCYTPPDPASQAWLRQRLRRVVMARRHGLPMPATGKGLRLLATLARPWVGGEDSLTAIPWTGQGRLLDYGCGSGWFAQRMRQLGWSPTAMDFSAHAVAQVRRHFGLPVLAGTLPHPDVAPSSYDVVTLGAVLEHVHRPHQLIAAATEALRPGGLLVVAVPNFASWGRRYFGPHWWGLHLPQHLLHFEAATLRRLLENHGLIVESLRTIDKASWLRRSADAARRQGDRRRLVQLARYRPVLGLAARWTTWSGQADALLAFARRPRLSARANVG